MIPSVIVFRLLQKESLHHALAFYINFGIVAELVIASGLLLCSFCYMDFLRKTGTFHSACYIYSVAPDVVNEFCFTDNTRNNRTGIYANQRKGKTKE